MFHVEQPYKILTLNKNKQKQKIKNKNITTSKTNRYKNKTNTNMFHVEHTYIYLYSTYYLPKQTNNTLISEGETPLIRAACPIVLGFILPNFCVASVESEPNLV